MKEFELIDKKLRNENYHENFVILSCIIIVKYIRYFDNNNKIIGIFKQDIIMTNHDKTKRGNSKSNKLKQYIKNTNVYESDKKFYYSYIEYYTDDDKLKILLYQYLKD